jgi:hypothetical protein
MNKIFQKSLELAYAQFPDWNNDTRTFHVSFLFERTRLLCMAQNDPRTSTRNIYNNVKKFDMGVKARCSELNLFLKAKNKFDSLDWHRLKLVNVRINAHGELKMSRPCTSCCSLLHYLDVRTVYYTDDNGNFQLF